MKKTLSDRFPQCRVEVFETLDSTNTYCLTQARSQVETPLLVVADTQTAGRGRRGKTWYSPPQANLYLSLMLQRSAGAKDLSGLTLAVGVEIAKFLKNKGLSDVALKWPNDIWVGQRKLGGILVELQGPYVVIGVGLNVNMPQDAPIEAEWVDLKQIVGETPSQEALAIGLTEALFKAFEGFMAGGMAAYHTAFQTLDALYQQPIRVRTEQGEFTTTAEGITAEGLLKISSPPGVLTSGDVSVAKK